MPPSFDVSSSVFPNTSVRRPATRDMSGPPPVLRMGVRGWGALGAWGGGGGGGGVYSHSSCCGLFLCLEVLVKKSPDCVFK